MQTYSPTCRGAACLAALIGTLAVLLLLVGCKSAIPTSAPDPTTAFEFTPYRTYTASPVPSQAARIAAATIPVTPTPTATPFLHTVKKDETMLGIALTYGVQLADLLAANPQVDPHMMSIGITLTVPITGEAFAAAPVITPVPLVIDPPTCYRTGDGGAWCFALIHNDRETAVENVSTAFGLFSEDGSSLAAQEAIPPLNRIEAGEALPVSSFFAGPLPEVFFAQADLITAIDVSDSGQRYLDAQITNYQSDISEDGVQAHLTGTIEIVPNGEMTETLPARLVWVAAVAYDQENNVVGMRKWESNDLEHCSLSLGTPTPGQESTPLPEDCFQFDMIVSSLGPKIAKVEVFTEVRP